MDNENQRNLVYQNLSETYCRLCFSQIYELHQLFPPDGQPNHLLVKKIEYCIGICITFAKDSNSSICTKCVGLIEEFFHFKQLCDANEQWFKEHLLIRAARTSANTSEVTIEDNTEPDTNSCPSLLTIDTEHEYSSSDFRSQIWDSQPLMESPRRNLVEKVTHTNSNNNEASNDTYRLRARKPTTRFATTSVLNPSPAFQVKKEIDSEVDTHENDSLKASTSAIVNDIPNLTESSTKTPEFQLVRGAKSRSDRQYLVYHGFRYSNNGNNNNIWRCTHHAPICCKAVVMLDKGRVLELNNHYHNHAPPKTHSQKRQPEFLNNANVESKSTRNIKISMVLKKEKKLPSRATKKCSASQQRQSNGWSIKANRKTVDGFTYTFCGLGKDGVIRLKCITKGCSGRLYMYAHGDLLGVYKEHNHAAHISE